MTATYKIKDFDTINKIGTTSQKDWFRSHSKVYCELTPGVFRTRFNGGINGALSPLVSCPSNCLIIFSSEEIRRIADIKNMNHQMLTT